LLEVALKQAIVILLSRRIRRLSKRANIQDQLLADFAAEQLAKVEIYSFAAAANHFSVPYTLVQPIKGKKADMSDGHVGASGEGDGKGPDDRKKRFVFGAVEHFANTRDYVSEIGESLIVLPMLQVLGPKDALLGEFSSASARWVTCSSRTSKSTRYLQASN
jgi:hypothetical protein